MPQGQLSSVSGKPFPVTGTGIVTDVPSVTAGFYVNSTSAGTLVFRDGTASGVAIGGTITPAVGWHTYAFNFSKGVHITVANTIDITVSINIRD